MKTKGYLGLVALSISAALIAVFVYAKVFQPEPEIVMLPAEEQAQYVNLPAMVSAEALDFTRAIEQSIDAVVHVKTMAYREYRSNPFMEWFFGEQPEGEAPPVMGYGSGVIISDKGYIVTNNHVISGSDEIVVILNNKKEYTAQLIGADPNSDLALLKVDVPGLEYLTFGDSDALRLGEWVLAIGNPYNLTSTVTAGIVSAKARSINILRSQEFGIESFIQTDAAVNPGNSGGALINIKGELVGINTAIASRTGAFSGYSFAIPVSIVQKIVKDLIDYGEVQRAVLGIEIRDVTAELAKEKEMDALEGVYINMVRPEGAAKEAGLKEGDVIISIDGHKVNSPSELQESISLYSPGDQVTVVVKRGNKLKPFELILRNLDGNTEIVKQEDILAVLGATFEPLSDKEKSSLGIKSGLKVKTVNPGKFAQIGIQPGFVLTSVNKTPVNSVKDVSAILENSEGGVIIEGLDRKGSKSYYAFGM